MSEAGRGGFLGSNRSRLIAALAFVTGLLIAAVIILIVSRTTFTAQTSTEPNTWSTGTVVLTNDHSGSSVFNATNLKPGDTDTEVVQVQYTGSIAVDVHMYAESAVSSPSLADYIDLAVNAGNSPTGPFNQGTWTGTLTALQGLTFTDAVLPWSTTGSGSESRYYQIQYTLNSGTPNAMQGQTTTSVFTWEAHAS